jgi:hypothetical protein
VVGGVLGEGLIIIVFSAENKMEMKLWEISFQIRNFTLFWQK